MDNIYGTIPRSPVECFIRITTNRLQYDTAKYEQFGIVPSLFDSDASQNEEFYPEDYADELNNAINEILKIENSKFGSPLSLTDPTDFTEENEDELPEDTEELTPAEILNSKLEQLLQLLQSDNTEEDDSFIIETQGTIEMKVENACEIFEVRYKEDESMDNTDTVLRYDPSHPHSLVITREGGVVSNLICDEGKRHISIYETPIMPFEISVYTKKCRGWLSMKGGQITLDYILELRGADIQQTKMNIEIYPK